MSKKLVVDSSVIIKWLNTTNESYIGQADRIMEEALQGKVELIAPELAKYEIGNVLLKSKELTPQQANISLGTVHSLPITFVKESEYMAFETFSLAYENKVTYYDAAFLSIAKTYNATLVTENIKHQGKSSDIHVISLKDY